MRTVKFQNKLRRGEGKCFIVFFSKEALKKKTLGDSYADHSYTNSLSFFLLTKFRVNFHKQKFLMSFSIEEKNLQ